METYRSVPLFVWPLLLLFVLMIVVIALAALDIDVPVGPTFTPKASSPERCARHNEDPRQATTNSLFQLDLHVFPPAVSAFSSPGPFCWGVSGHAVAPHRA
jgi:hypothetical protein